MEGLVPKLLLRLPVEYRAQTDHDQHSGTDDGR
jgi:hypothetical protein